MNKKLWLFAVTGLLSLTAYAEPQPNPYVTNSQQLIDASSAQAKQSLSKAYPPPVAMTPVTPAKIGGGATVQPPPAQPGMPSASPQQPTDNQPVASSDNANQTTSSATPSADQQTTQQPGYQENVAVPQNSNSTSTGSVNSQSGGVSTGNNSGSSNMYR